MSAAIVGGGGSPLTRSGLVRTAIVGAKSRYRAGARLIVSPGMRMRTAVSGACSSTAAAKASAGRRGSGSGRAPTERMVPQWIGTATDGRMSAAAGRPTRGRDGRAGAAGPTRRPGAGRRRRGPRAAPSRRRGRCPRRSRYASARRAGSRATGSAGRGGGAGRRARRAPPRPRRGRPRTCPRRSVPPRGRRPPGGSSPRTRAARSPARAPATRRRDGTSRWSACAVRDEDRVQREQLLDRGRRDAPADVRDPLAQHRVGEDAHATKLDEQRRVTDVGELVRHASAVPTRRSWGAPRAACKRPGGARRHSMDRRNQGPDHEERRRSNCAWGSARFSATATTSPAPTSRCARYS